MNSFVEDVLTGLRAKNKFLSSKYFYDAQGDKLFQQIMHLEEYYLTKKELEIFNTHKQRILEAIKGGDEPFRIIELGAGDGLKTKVLLKHFMKAGVDFAYTPVDISGNVLEILEQNLLKEIPGLRIESYEGDYFEALAEIAKSPEKDVVFFLGSNVGNFSGDEATVFLNKLNLFLNQGDLLFMGVDLKKDPEVILSAYNDKDEITKKFNLNLLERINIELDGNFDLDQFIHYPYYNPHTGECRSYLISKKEQTVAVAGNPIHFNAWEAIFMEVSKKYDQKQLKKLAKASGFSPKQIFLDKDHWFADVLWEK